MQKKCIAFTKHASDRAIKYDLNSETIKRIIEEGKEKVKYVFRSKHGVYVAICAENPEQIIIITLTKGK